MKNGEFVKLYDYPFADYLLKELSLYSNNSRRILDVGYNERPNYYLTGDVIGLDIETDKKPTNYLKTVKGSAMKMPFNDDSFDCVILGYTLCMLDNPISFFKEAKRILKNKGLLLISSPNPYSLKNILRFMLSFDKKAFDSKWCFTLTPQDIIHMYKSFNFDNIDIHRTYTEIPILKVKTRVTNKIFNDAFIYYGVANKS